MWNFKNQDFIKQEWGEPQTILEVQNLWKIANQQSQDLGLLRKQKQKIIELISKMKSIKNQNESLHAQLETIQKQLENTKYINFQLEQQLNELKNWKKQYEQQHKKQSQKLAQTLKQALILNEHLQCQNQSLASTSYTKPQHNHNQIQKLKKTIEQLTIKLCKKQTSQEQTIQQLTKLIQRQNKTLNLQDQECKKLYQDNQMYSKDNHRLSMEVEQLQLYHSKNQMYLKEMYENVQKLMGKIQKQNVDWEIIMQIERIRLKMREQATSQVERIQNIVNQL